MHLKRPVYLLILFCLTILPGIAAQETITISGYVLDVQSRAMEFVNVLDKRTKKTAITDIDGFYSMTLPATDTLIIRYSCLSYQTATRIIPVGMNNLRVNVIMSVSSRKLNDITVRGQQKRTNTLESLDASKIRLLPDASGGSIEALLVTFAGVSSNNELSSQYSVRGGNYDENLVYVNGTEVYRPLLIRAGQQEGLSFINPEMVEEVKFSAGGFDASYGDKMSSVLDIKYKKPEALEAYGSASLLGTNLYVGHASKDGKFTQIHGFRYKTNEYLLGTLDTKGEYNPTFIDYQTYLTWKVTPTTELSFLGNFSKNTYQFVPEEEETDFGTSQQRFRFTVDFDGQENDLFQTTFGSLTLNKTFGKNVKVGLQSSFFRTDEDENYDITGQYWLSETPLNNNEDDTLNTSIIGIGTYHEHARNHLTATVFNITHTGSWKSEQHTGQWGLAYQREIINDELREWEMRDSSGYSMPYSDSKINTVYFMKSQVNMESNRITGYLQDTWRFREEAGVFVITGGIRGTYWDFNDEMLISPRASVAFLPAWDKDFSFRFASGVYYQAPFYKELRDTTTINGVTQILLNRNIKAQKTIHYVAGMDYHFVWVDRPFKFTVETYYKDMSNLIPYTVDNVRIRYYGKNMAEGYTAGLDMKLFGEFVPGTDSWISLSFMKSQETINGITIPRPNEQRYNASIFFQDYFPNYPKFNMHLKLIWADGLPFGPPGCDRTFATLRMPPYRRVDIGMSRVFSAGENKLMKKGFLKNIKNIWVGVDCFNLLNTNNVNSYYWVTDISNIQYAVPNHLTGRQINLRLAAEI
jgi:hypothetical protein